MAIPVGSSASQQWVTRLKVEPGTGAVSGSINHPAALTANSEIPSQGDTNIVQAPVHTQGTSLSMECPYEEVFKEITKKLYGDEGLAEVIDGSGNIHQANIIYESDAFRGETAGGLPATGGLTLVAGPNGLPPGTIVLQRRLHQDEKGRLWASVDMPHGEPTAVVPNATNPQDDPLQASSTVAAPIIEERWFESDEALDWTDSKIARYNPSQKVFRCVDCDFVGFLSRVAEHWLGNHASLRVFQCPRCPYTSAWARCVRMHLTRQHGETLTDNSLWKENPVLEEYKTQVTKFLTTLKTKVEQKGLEANSTGERRYTCPYCPYATDRRDLYNRHENIHRDEKPFQCYVCDKQFNRADHVKKHFVRMHRDHPYDINKIKKHFPKIQGGVVPYHNSKMANKQAQRQQHPQHMGLQAENTISEITGELGSSTVSPDAISLQLPGTNQTVTVQQIPHIAYFNPPSTPGQSGPLQGIAGVGGTKKESKSKGQKKKKSGEKMYTCSYCPWQGVDNWCLKRHLNTHIKPFLCALCDYKAARSERLATHVLKVHNKRVCHKCSFLADDTESLSQHIQDSHQNPLVKTGFNCNVCQEYFELRADLEAHAILEHQKVIVQCDLCDFRTTDELSMEAHLRDKHNLQPGMGAVAAAAAAAAAAANGQPTSTQYQVQIQTQPQIHSTEHSQQSALTSIDHHSMLTSDMLQQSNIVSGSMASSTTEVGALVYSQDSNENLVPKSEPGSLNGAADDAEASKVVEPELELEPETLCEKCGIEFADEASLKLHRKRHEADKLLADSVNPAASKPKKTLPRTYVCSTCSYTAATKNMMMQHQRAHNGLELVCQAEYCLFSTPFENTLKEHIHAEHGNEANVRCPHCGLRIPSINAFTYHWRSHHLSVCSLCVNLYRIKYSIKENDLHEIISKQSVDLLNEDFAKKISTTEPLHAENHSDQLEKLLCSSEQSEEEANRSDDNLNCLTIPNNNNNNNSLEDLDESPRKKSRVDFSHILKAVAKKNNRESLRIIPNMKEVLVIPVISEAQVTLWKSKCDHFKTMSFGPHVKSKRAVLLDKMFRKIQHNFVNKSLTRVHPVERYLSRGTKTWLKRNQSQGFKCYNPLCLERVTWRYTRKVSFILHNLWHHHNLDYKCDCCDLKFPHLYQALLHKKNNHPFSDDNSRDDHLQFEDFNSATSTVQPFSTGVVSDNTERFFPHDD